MDVPSTRKKAKARAEAKARKEAAAPPPAAPAAAEEPAEAGGRPLEDALRAELRQLETGHAPPLPAAPLPPPAAAPVPPAPAPPEPEPAAPLDALAEFFWREDELVPPLPDLGQAEADPRGAAHARPAERSEFVTFLLGSEEYGVAIGRVREILRPPPITEVPRAPAHVLGVLTLRGEVVAVVDPRRRLGLPPAPPRPRAPVVVCETAQGPVGLQVDGVAQVVRLAPSAIEVRPPGVGGAAAEAIAGIGREGDRLVVLLDLDVLLGPAGPEAAA